MPIKVLIVGKSSFLGSSLALLMPDAEFNVTAVGREIVDLSLPIPDSFRKFLAAEAFNFAIICAAITDVEQCSREERGSNQVNIKGTLGLLEVLKHESVTPLFFSSDYVFPPKEASHREDDPREPSTVYGKQKLIVENYLVDHFRDYLVFRTNKLMSLTSHPKNILWPIIKNLSENKCTGCFHDQWINPVFVEDIATALKLCMKKGISGIYHLGTRKMMSRYQIGQLLADLLDCNPELIQPTSRHEVFFSEPRPSHHTLDCRKIESTLNFQFKEIFEVKEQLIALRPR